MPSEIYLIRHTTPDVAKGICYGQTDIGSARTLLSEAAVIRQSLPDPTLIHSVYSSPLQRCARLANLLFPAHAAQYQHDLMEINCGHWEMKHWDEIPAGELDPWMEDFVQVRIPGGESYIDLYERVTRSFTRIREETFLKKAGASILVTHGGPIRSILSFLTGIALKDSFGAFSLHYGCVIRICPEDAGPGYEILSNPSPAEKEQHKPSRFYRR